MALSIDTPPDWRELLARELIADAISAASDDEVEYRGLWRSLLCSAVPTNLGTAVIDGLRGVVSNFGALRLFHGCSIKDESDYRIHGLLRSDSTRLTALAHRIFGETAEVRDAIRDLGWSYLRYNEGKVFVTYSLKFALSNQSTHTEGSEFLRSVANRLGTAGITKYEMYRGRRALIEIRLPSHFVTPAQVEAVASRSFLEWLSSISSFSNPDDHLCGGFPILRDLSPDNITNIYYRKNEPNKAMEPTPVNVTVPASAGPAPFTSAAHL